MKRAYVLFITGLTLFGVYESGLHGADSSLWDDVLLIINFNHPHFEHVGKLRELYSTHFPHIVFYGAQPYPDVELCEHHLGFTSYQAIAMAMEKYPHYQGYFFVHDDCLLNFWNFRDLDRSKIWFSAINMETSLYGSPNPLWAWWWPWESPYGIAAVKRMYNRIPDQNKSRLARNAGEHTVLGGFSDIAYIPARYKNEFIELAKLFAEEKVFLEIALPMIVWSIEYKENFYYFDGLALWGTDRSKFMRFYQEDLDFIHPAKFTDAKLWDAVRSKIAEYVDGPPTREPLLTDNSMVQYYEFNRKIPKKI